MIQSLKYREIIVECAKKLYQNIKVPYEKILITGAYGMIGSVIVDIIMELNNKYSCQHQIIAVGRNEERARQCFSNYFARSDFRYVNCDVNQVIPELGDVDCIIHAASNTHPLAYSGDPIGTITTNVIGNYNLLEYARKHNIKRYVFLSTVEIYGENTGNLEAFAEKDMGYIDCNITRAGYPESKRLSESMCCAYREKYGIDVVIPRVCRVYGPTMGRNDSKALAQFIRKSVANEDIVLKSEGEQYFSYINVVDAAMAILSIIVKGISGEAYNVSSDFSNIKLKDLAAKLAELAGTRVVFDIPDEKERQGYSKVTKAILDNTKLKQLGWNELYDMDSGLKMTYGILKEIAEKGE